MSNRHKNLPAGKTHVAHSWEYADSAEREAAIDFVSADIGKLALQMDDFSFWVLQDVTPTWVAVGSDGGGSGLVLLESHVASNSALLAFISGITGAYDNYLLELVDLILQTNNVNLLMQYSTDGGSSYDTSNNYYSSSFLVRNGGGTDSTAGNPSTAHILGAGVSNTSSRPFSGSLKMSAFPSTALSKPIFGNVAYTNQSFVVGGFLQGLLLVPSTAYNALKIYCSSGNIVSGVARLYGVAG